MIVVNLMGRIGNQLFMYAYARGLQLERKKNEKIVIYDEPVISMGWKNSLKEYPLPNVEYISKWDDLVKVMSKRNRIAVWVYHWLYYHRVNKNGKVDHVEIRKFEERWKKFFEIFGLVACESGYMDIRPRGNEIFLMGYFQSEKYFCEYADQIRKEYDITQQFKKLYPRHFLQIDENTVCISIKVEHNADNPDFNVCTEDYYARALQYMQKETEVSKFFICSDNVEYVKKNLINTDQYETIEQDTNIPVEMSLAMMSLCKYFIIGNTTFAWWAQYLSQFENKIVIAPSRWKNCDQNIDIYQNHWITLEV